jgi:hypothetical protein
VTAEPRALLMILDAFDDVDAGRPFDAQRIRDQLMALEDELTEATRLAPSARNPIRRLITFVAGLGEVVTELARGDAEAARITFRAAMRRAAEQEGGDNAGSR